MKNKHIFANTIFPSFFLVFLFSIFVASNLASRVDREGNRTDQEHGGNIARTRNRDDDGGGGGSGCDCHGGSGVSCGEAKSIYGVCINANWDNQFPSQGDIQDLKAQWVRTLVMKGKYDRIHEAIHRYNNTCRLLTILNHESLGINPPANDDDAGWEQYQSLFASMVLNFTLEFKDHVKAFEIWNEPDLQGIRADRFASILKTSYTTIKGISPQSSVILGGLAGPNWPQYLKDTTNILGKQFYDYAGMHPYGQRAKGYPPNYGFGEIEDVLITVNDISKAAVWVTEFGLPLESVPDDDKEAGQALYLKNAFQIFEKLGPSVVGNAFWFAYTDYVHWKPDEERFGLTRDGYHRQSYQMFKLLSH